MRHHRENRLTRARDRRSGDFFERISPLGNDEVDWTPVNGASFRSGSDNVWRVVFVPFVTLNRRTSLFGAHAWGTWGRISFQEEFLSIS